ETHPDLYLEGSDQHRGWFQSSLLCAVGTRGRAPFKSVLTHGFILDEDARKMSKSVGNVIAPQKIVASHGADILRLWVAAEDYRDDVRISKEILDRASEAYRRIRNTARFLIGNLAGFDPALDIVKDRLYCEGAASHERRSGQTALHHLLEALVRLMAPILSFTAEEIWGYLSPDARRPASVLLADFPAVDPELRDARLAADWEALLAVRAAVTKTLEGLRTRGEIGHSLEADVRIAAPAPTAA